VNGLSKVASALAELEALDRSELAVRWEAQMSCSAPKASSRIFLLRALSYELQSKHAAGLSKADLKALHGRRGAALPSVSKPKPKRKPPVRLALVPGARLVREWNGKPYTVSVIKEGFVYKDRVWSSLSAIAKDITGAHWSGPRFFGLDKAA